MGHEDFTRCSNICGIVVLVEIKNSGIILYKDDFDDDGDEEALPGGCERKIDCTEEQIRDSQTEEKLFSKLIKFHL